MASILNHLNHRNGNIDNDPLSEPQYHAYWHELCGQTRQRVRYLRPELAERWDVLPEDMRAQIAEAFGDLNHHATWLWLRRRGIIRTLTAEDLMRHFHRTGADTRFRVKFNLHLQMCHKE